MAKVTGVGIGFCCCCLAAMALRETNRSLMDDGFGHNVQSVKLVALNLLCTYASV